MLNPALALGARISGAALRTVVYNCPWTIFAAGLDHEWDQAIANGFRVLVVFRIGPQHLFFLKNAQELKRVQDDVGRQVEGRPKREQEADMVQKIAQVDRMADHAVRPRLNDAPIGGQQGKASPQVTLRENLQAQPDEL